VRGTAYFENDIRSAQGIEDSSPGTSIFNGTPKVYPFIAINFGALIAATGITPDGQIAILLPDLFENPDKAFGYTVNCQQ
jgi:hypothetical protein